MRIQLLQALSGVMKHYRAGRVVDWEEADALRLIERGAAVLVEVTEVAPTERRVRGKSK